MDIIVIGLLQDNLHEINEYSVVVMLNTTERYFFWLNVEEFMKFSRQVNSGEIHGTKLYYFNGDITSLINEGRVFVPGTEDRLDYLHYDLVIKALKGKSKKYVALNNLRGACRVANEYEVNKAIRILKEQGINKLPTMKCECRDTNIMDMITEMKLNGFKPYLDTYVDSDTRSKADIIRLSSDSVRNLKRLIIPDGVMRVSICSNIRIGTLSIGNYGIGNTPYIENDEDRERVHCEKLIIREGAMYVTGTNAIEPKETVIPRSVCNIGAGVARMIGSSCEVFNTGDYAIILDAYFGEYVENLKKIILGKSLCMVAKESLIYLNNIEVIEIHSNICTIMDRALDSRTHLKEFRIRRNAKVNILDKVLVENIRSKRCKIVYID